MDQRDGFDPYIEAVKGFEGFTPRAAWDYKQHSIGYGTRGRPGETITKEEADARLRQEWAAAKARVQSLGVPMTPGQEAALTSLTFNSGDKWAASGLGDAVRAGDWDAARQHLLQYTKAGGETLPGLVDRRRAEAQWMTGGEPRLAQPAQDVLPANGAPLGLYSPERGDFDGGTPFRGNTPPPPQPAPSTAVASAAPPTAPAAPAAKDRGFDTSSYVNSLMAAPAAPQFMPMPRLLPVTPMQQLPMPYAANGGGMTRRNITDNALSSARRGYADGGSPDDSGGDGEAILPPMYDRFGPMSPATRAGLPDRPLSPTPSLTDRALQVADWASLPAKAVVGVAKQPYYAGEAVGKAIHEPTWPTMTNAAVQTAFALGQPAKALKLLGLGYGAAAADQADVNPFSVLKPGEAEAAPKKGSKSKPAAPDIADLPGLEAGQNAEYKEARRRLEASEYDTPAVRRMLEATVTRLSDLSASFAGKHHAVDAEKQAEEQRQKQAEYDRRVKGAEAARALELARDTRFADTPVGKMYGETGGASPFLGALGFGALSRAATGAGQSTLGKVLNRGVLPAVEGTGAAFTANSLPLAYEAFSTPVLNPKREAFLAAAQELPDGHPDKERFAKLAAELPAENPIRAQAHDEFFGDLPKRALISAAEGVPSALAGANFPELASRLKDKLFGEARKDGAGITQRITDAVVGTPEYRAQRAAGVSAAPPVPPAGAGSPAGGQAPAGGAQAATRKAPPPNPQQGQGRAVQSAPGSYGAPQQSIARPLVDSEIMAGRGVPTERDLSRAYTEAGIPTPTSRSYANIADKTKNIVADLHAAGKSPREIVGVLEALRANGMPVLGVPAALGLGLAGTGTDDRANGGPVDHALTLARDGGAHVGPLVSAIGGRTDHIPVSVPNGAYVIPADVVSGMGEGNTANGHAILSGMFTQSRPQRPRRANGGATDDVPIMAAGGEHVIGPEDVRKLGGGDLDAGHAVLDRFVLNQRAKYTAHLANLPPPEQD